MKKLFTLVAMAFMAIGANAQEGAIAYEIDWTDTEETPWWTGSPCEVSVEKGVGLIIESGGDGTDVYWNPQIPMIQHMASIDEGGQYVVKFWFTTPAAGELRLDFGSWDGTGATLAKVIEVDEGDNYKEVDMLDYPTACTDAFIFYQSGKLPGKHIVKKVEVWDLDATTGIKDVKNKVQNNIRYNLAGQQVDANYKGAVIVNGKKYIQK